MKKIVIFYLLQMGLLLATDYGWDVPNSSLNIGGYLDISYDEKREDPFLFDDIATIFSANEGHFDVLGEIELSHISIDGKSNSRNDIDVNIERLHLSYAINDEQIFQVGRFNSDVGYWNQAPITILQDTTTTPHSVGNFFPKATTGLLYRNSINPQYTFSLTLQHNNDLAHQDGMERLEEHKAFAYHGEKDDLSWGLFLGSYRYEDKPTAQYAGVGATYEMDNLSVQGELFIQNAEKEEEKPYSAYLQSTWHFKEKQDGVLRVESYQDNALEVNEESYLLGYVYRPNKNMALKGEYLYHTKLPLNRFVYSFSVLF